MSELDPSKVQALFDEALQRPPEERPAFLALACGENADLRRRLDELLSASAEVGDFLPENPANATTFPLSLKEPRSFGDYELLEEIARGGMGVVFKARDVKLKRLVALKLIPSGSFASEAIIKRFKTEAEAAAGLSHPNIVPIYEIGEVRGQHYISMGLIDGLNLRQHLAKKEYSPHQSAALIAILARAVHHAHQHGVLHRDINPSNILIDRDGAPHLTDFGIAKIAQRDSTLTHTTAILGTPSYMAPEQGRGDSKNVTTAADVYGLGAVLYVCLTGQPPFAGGTTYETIRKLLEEEPRPPSEWNHAVNHDLETICLKCLEKEPSRRYSSADLLARDLQRWIDKEPIEARPASAPERISKWVQRKPVIAGLSTTLVIAILLGIAGILWQWRRAEVERKAALELTVAERKARIAEAAAKENTQKTVARLELQKIDELTGNSGVTKAKALPFLARSLRQNPDNRDIAFRLLMTLMHESFAWPLYERELKGHRLLDVTVETNGVIVLAQETNGLLNLLNILSNTVLFAPTSQKPVHFARFSGSSEQFLLQYTNLEVKVFRRPFSNTNVITFTTTAPLVGALFDSDHDRLFTVERLNWQNSSIRVWELSTGKALAGPFEQTAGPSIEGLTLDERRLVLFGGHTLDLRDGSFARGTGMAELYPQTTRLSSISSGDQQLQLGWGFGNAAISLPLTAHEVERRMSETLSTLVQLPLDGGLKVMDLRSRKALPSLFGAESVERELTKVSRDGRRVAISTSREVNVRDAVSRQVLWTHRLSSNTVPFRIELSQSGDWLWLAPVSGPTRLFQVKGNGIAREITVQRPPHIWLTGASLSQDASRLAVSLSDGAVYFYNTVTGQLLWQFPVSKEGEHVTVRLLSDDQHILASTEYTIAVLKAANGSLFAKATFAQDPLAETRLVQWWDTSPNSQALAVSDAGSIISIYTLPALQKVAEFPYDARLSGLKFSPDGTLLAILSDLPGKVRVWNWSTKELVAEFAFSYCDAKTLAFSPDNRRVLVGGAQMSRIYDIQSGSALTDEFEVVTLPDIIETRWTRDDFLVRVAAGGAGWTYELPRVEEPVPRWLPELAEALAGQRLTDSSLTTRLSFSDFQAVKAAIDSYATEGFYRTFGRWFISDPSERTCSPRIRLNALDSISLADSRGVRGNGTDQALGIARGNRTILTAAAKERLEFFFQESRPTSSTPEGQDQQARYRAKIAWNTMELMKIHDPGNALGSFLKAAGWMWVGRPEKALQTLGQPTEPLEYYWIIRAHALSKQDPANAREAWEQAYALTEESRRKRGVGSQFKEFLASRGDHSDAGRINCQGLGIPERRPDTPLNLVDLSSSYNVSTRPSNNGTVSEPHLENLPLGVAAFAQTQFDVRGVLDLRKTQLAPIRDVQVGLSGSPVHFLHGSMGGNTKFDGVTVGTYVLYYADGSKEKIPIVYGKHVRACFFQQDQALASDAAVAWTGNSPYGHQDNSQIRLFKMSWENPKPTVKIARIGFESAGSPLLLLGITVEH